MIQTCNGSVTEEQNQNLTTAQKLLLKWHFQLGHVSFSLLKWIAREGYLGADAAHMASADTPLCASCQYGKGKCLPTHGVKQQANPDVEGALKDGVLQPGQVVAMDQYETSTKG